MRSLVAIAVASTAITCAAPALAATPESGAVVPAASRGSQVLTGTYGRLDGKRIDLTALRGRVVMVVNTASHCGFTSQYGGLETLWRSKRAAGLTVVGVPSRDFKQELPTDGQVAKFCKLNFGVTFPMLRISRVTGPRAIALMRGVAAPSWSHEPEWNFTKYLVDRQGRVAMRFTSSVEPDAPEVTRAVSALLAEKA